MIIGFSSVLLLKLSLQGTFSFLGMERRVVNWEVAECVAGMVF